MFLFCPACERPPAPDLRDGADYGRSDPAPFSCPRPCRALTVEWAPWGPGDGGGFRMWMVLGLDAARESYVRVLGDGAVAASKFHSPGFPDWTSAAPGDLWDILTASGVLDS